MTSDEKVDYVQVDKEKTQALQSTMQEWTDVRQSTEPAKGVKSWHWPGRKEKKKKKIPILSQASPVSCLYHYYEYWLGLFKTEIFGQ